MANKSQLRILKMLPADTWTIKAILGSHNSWFMMVIHVSFPQSPAFQ